MPHRDINRTIEEDDKTSQQVLGSIFDRLLHEYDCLWNYYIVLLNERHTLFNNYILIIGVPLTAIGFIIGIIGNNAEELYNTLFISMKPILFFVMVVLFAVGVLMYFTYVSETINAASYYKRIVKIRKHLAEIQTKAGEAYGNIIGRNHYLEIYDVKDDDKRASTLDATKVLKISILPVINSAILTGALMFMLETTMTIPILCGGISLLLQESYYIVKSKWIERKGKRQHEKT